MLAWLRRRRAPPPLTGAPAVRRLKTYSAASGYVYQYFYDGHRPAAHAGETGVEYVFQVSADRVKSQPTAVFLPDATIEAWQRSAARELSATERYAVAKLILFQTFDECPDPSRAFETVVVRDADLTAVAAQLGFL